MEGKGEEMWVLRYGMSLGGGGVVASMRGSDEEVEGLLVEWWMRDAG